MAFGINNAAYGRSREGFRQATNNVSEYLRKLEVALTHFNENYTNFQKTVRDNWSGDDAENFLTEVEKTRNELWYHINREVRPKFDENTGILRNDLEEFVREQSAIDVSR